MNPNKYCYYGEVREYLEDEHIFTEGVESSEMYYLISGMVTVKKCFMSDIRIISPCEIFGEVDFIVECPRSEVALVATKSKVLAISRKNFEFFISENTDIFCKIIKDLSYEIKVLRKEKENELIRNRQLQSKFTKNKEKGLVADEKKKIYKKSDESHKCSSPPEILSELFLKGHKFYDFTAPDSHQKYLYEKAITCPVCNRDFQVEVLQYSKLKLIKTEASLRKIYKDIDPLWYAIIVCSNCCYANHHNDFFEVSDKFIKKIKEKITFLRQNIALSYTLPRQINQVFTAYYMAITCIKNLNINPVKIGRLWLSLSWLYNDIGDYNLYIAASNEAFKYYYDALYNSRFKLSDEQEQQCCLVISELYLSKEDKNAAIKHLQMAIKQNSGSPVYTKQAQNRIYDIKEQLILK